MIVERLKQEHEFELQKLLGATLQKTKEMALMISKDRTAFVVSIDDELYHIPVESFLMDVARTHRDWHQVRTHLKVKSPMQARESW